MCLSFHRVAVVIMPSASALVRPPALLRLIRLGSLTSWSLNSSHSLQVAAEEDHTSCSLVAKNRRNHIAGPGHYLYDHVQIRRSESRSC